MVTLDDALSSVGVAVIEYLKIDVEGYELFVVTGAERIIRASRNIIIQTELNETVARRYGHGVTDVAEQLSSFGLTPRLVAGDGSLLDVDNFAGGQDFLWASPERWRSIDAA